MVTAHAPDVRPGDPVAEILVVCTGNIARSPFAEALLRREADRLLGADAPIRITSAGIHAVIDGPATEGARREAAARGLDLDAHHGRLLDPDEVRRADLVITMSERQRAHVVRAVPDALRTTFTLEELSRLIAAMKPLEDHLPPRQHVQLVARIASGARPYVARPQAPEDVRDPHRRGEEVYAAVCQQIEDGVALIAPVLFANQPTTE